MKIKNRNAQGGTPGRKQNGKTSSKGEKSSGKRPQNKVSHELDYKLRATPNISNRYQKYARQIIYPGDTSDSSVLPARVPAQLCPRIIRKNFVLGADNVDAQGSTVIVMEPDMLTPAYILRGASQVLGPTARLKVTSERLTADPLGLKGVIKVMDGEVGTTMINNLVPIPDSTATSRNGFLISNVGATTFDIYVTAVSQFVNEAVLRVWTKTAAGAWTAAGATGFLPSIGKTTFKLGLSMPASTDAMAFSLLDPNDAYISSKTYSISLDMIIGNGVQEVTYTSGNEALNLFQEIPEYILDNDINDVRLTSMSLLVTNTSPPLYRSGEIYAARMQRKDLTTIADLPGHIVALPDNRKYIGSAETGAYVWWMPDTQELAEPAPLHDWTLSARKQEVIVVYIKGLGANVSFNCQFCWAPEFNTPNQLFEKRVTPPYTQEWEKVRYHLALMSAASCNPGHYDLFKSLVTRGVQGARNIYDHYNEHRQIYDGLLSILLKAMV